MVNFEKNLVMDKNTYKISLSYKQVLELVKQLPKKDKVRLSRELTREVVDSKLTRLLNAFSTEEITEEMIVEEVGKIRTDIYASKKKDLSNY